MGAATAYLPTQPGFQWALASPSEFQAVAHALESPGSVLEVREREACLDAIEAYVRLPGASAQRMAVASLVDAYRADYLHRIADADWQQIVSRFVGWSDRRRAVDTKVSFLDAHALDFGKLGIIPWPHERRPLPTFRDLEDRVRCAYSAWTLQPAADLAPFEDCRDLLKRQVRPLSLNPHWRFAHRRWMHPYESVLHDFLHFGSAVLLLNSRARVRCQVDLYDAANALLRGRDFMNLPCLDGFVSLREAILEGTLGIYDFGSFVDRELAQTLSKPPYGGVYEDAASIYGGLVVFLKGQPRSWWPAETDWSYARHGLAAAQAKLGMVSD